MPSGKAGKLNVRINTPLESVHFGGMCFQTFGLLFLQIAGYPQIASAFERRVIEIPSVTRYNFV